MNNISSRVNGAIAPRFLRQSHSDAVKVARPFEFHFRPSAQLGGYSIAAAAHRSSLRRTNSTKRAAQVCVLGSAEPGSPAYDLAGAAGEMLARRGVTVVSGCGAPATRVAAERALAAGGTGVPGRAVALTCPSSGKHGSRALEGKRPYLGLER